MNSGSRSGGETPKIRKKVTFHPSTILCDSDHIALTITRHSYIQDKGYTQYFIKLLCRGVEWTLHKRYRDFYNLHQELLKENQEYNIELPKLPEKRWFERQRWINRADEKYGWIRRIQLQDYLRAIVKIRVLRNESLSFWKFICMPKRVMFGPQTAEEIERENGRSVSSERPALARTMSPATPEKRPSLTLSPRAFLFPKPTVPTETTEEEGASEVVDTTSEAYNPEKDLESFNESLKLVAQEAVLRGLYGPKSPKADIDNVASIRKSSPESHYSESVTSSTPRTPNGSLKLNRIYDDNGDEIVAASPQARVEDLEFLASSNALKNTRLTSKDEFIVSGAPSSSGSGSSGGGGSAVVSGALYGGGGSATSNALRAPPIHAVQANELWSHSELTSALEAIQSEQEFDVAVHFAGPRSGPPSTVASPNVSFYNGSSAGPLDMNRADLDIFPRLDDKNLTRSYSNGSGGEGGGVAVNGIAAKAALQGKDDLPAAPGRGALPPHPPRQAGEKG